MTAQESNAINHVLIMPAGAKGGEGKTSAITGIVDYLHHNGFEVNLVDCDAENKGRGSLTNYFPETKRIDIRGEEGLDELIETTLAGSPITIADLGAGSGDATFRWSRDQLKAVRESGIRITLLGVIGTSSAGVEGLLTWAMELQNMVDYLLVLNERDGTAFPYLKESKPGKRFIELAQPKEVRFRRRVPAIQAELENRGLSARAALTAPAESLGSYLNLFSRKNRVRSYFESFNAQLDDVRQLLIP